MILGISVLCQFQYAIYTHFADHFLAHLLQSIPHFSFIFCYFQNSQTQVIEVIAFTIAVRFKPCPPVSSEIHLQIGGATIPYRDRWRHLYLISINFFQMWQDEFLSWNPSEWNGIQELVVPPSEVWLPDIAVINR